MELREGLKLDTMEEFRSYLEKVNGCPFTSPCPTEDLKSKTDGYSICLECCKRYLTMKKEV